MLACLCKLFTPEPHYYGGSEVYRDTPSAQEHTLWVPVRAECCSSGYLQSVSFDNLIFQSKCACWHNIRLYDFLLLCCIRYNDTRITA